MVSLSTVQASNAKIAKTLPAGLVGVFVGATSDIGEGTLKVFVKQTRQPRVYFVGRSQVGGTRITAQLKQLSHEGTYTFIKADVSLIKAVDDVCRQIASKEQAVNVLVQCQGTPVSKTST
jgi:short-subunit dehydrogenase